MNVSILQEIFELAGKTSQHKVSIFCIYIDVTSWDKTDHSVRRTFEHLIWLNRLDNNDRIVVKSTYNVSHSEYSGHIDGIASDNVIESYLKSSHCCH
ncbi:MULTISPECIES: hypothetical protein [Photorhabdus]|uniref:Uncharacterized protein n=2 Tax=Photorhabdus TaxID=29487 RepID=A0AAW6BQA4_9GAMM|nr:MULTISPECIES: hypothetical protein [Photorhabdus]EYU16565.1 hypothetical protein BA1DRAFT_00849 [Photorhabdus aegyptia]MDB6373869.1 hypothetical protein [Photorhabdus bodei]